jgi:DNA-binding transcriptional LysR family regulator
LRKPRNITLTQDGHVLLAYARRMLALRDEAWASIVRPDVKGRVTIGVPDDYASSLLPSVLRKFSASYPKVEIQVIGMPSNALAPLIKEGKIDLACMTRMKGLSADFIRLEPMVWAGNALGNEVWKERPLPIAVFAPGSVARAKAIHALERAKISYRTSYESPSVLGLFSMVEAGLAITALGRCSIPERFVQLGGADGLPPLPDLEIVLARSAGSNRPPCDFLAEQILTDLRI